MARRGAVADPALAVLLAVVGLAMIQAARWGEGGGILLAASPYAFAAVALVAVRATPRILEQDGSWIRGLASAGAVLSVWLIARAVIALPEGLGQPHGFYRMKVLVTSPVGDHNTAAGLLLVALVAAAVATTADRRWSWSVVIITVGTVATLSRGAAAVLVLVAVLAWLVAGRRQTAGVLTAAAVCCLSGVLFAATVLDASSPVALDSPAVAVGSDGPLGASVVGRLDLAVRGAEVGWEHPLLGVGIGRFQRSADDLPPPNDHAHQLLTHAFAEGGVPLLIAAVALPLLLAVRVFRMPRTPLRDVVLLGGVGLIAHAQFEILGGRIGYEVLLAVLLGLSAGPGPRAAGLVGDADAAPGPPLT